MTSWHPVPISMSLLPETMMSHLDGARINPFFFFKLLCSGILPQSMKKAANTVCGNRRKLEKEADCAVHCLGHSQISILLNGLIF